MKIFHLIFIALSMLILQACKDSKKEGKTSRADFPITIEFQIDDPEYADEDPSPYVHLDDPVKDIKYMRDANEIVLSSTELIIVIDYPVNKEWPFTVKSQSPKGFTRSELARIISETYKKMYKDEESSSKIKTIPLDERKGLINRNKTDGKYGIWGHDLGDLVLHTIEISKSADGTVKAYLGIDS